MYATIRTIHLVTGLILAAVITMYCVTGWVMAHREWFEGAQKRVTEHSLTSAVAGRMPAGLSFEEAASWHRQIGDELAMRGRPAARDPFDGGWQFEYNRPGTVEKLRVRPGTAEVALTVEEGGAYWMLNRLHHLHGYAGPARYTLWGFLVDVTSVALILFPLSGIYLWFVLKKDRRFGWAIFGLSSAYCVGSILHLLLGR